MADHERISRIIDELRRAHLDALICALPINVLMLSGYWPVVGTAVAIVTWEGQVGLLVPDGEKELASRAQPSEMESFAPGSLHSLGSGTGSLQAPMEKLLRRLGLGGNRIGIEAKPETVPVGYSALHLYGNGLVELLAIVRPQWQPLPADDLLSRLRSVKTRQEIAAIRLACEVAGKGFDAAHKRMTPGTAEIEVALSARKEFALPAANEGSNRADGFAWCMSGPNSAEAGNAFARSQSRTIQNGDVVLLHANSYLDGFWTDITRTFVCGPVTKHADLFSAVAAARDAALSIIRPGVAAKAVDSAARDVLLRRGFADFFTHGLGHEVGFGAISATNAPRLHPASGDILEQGMVFNVEPAIYLPNVVGIRHCDVVAVTATGFEVLTPWLPMQD